MCNLCLKSVACTRQYDVGTPCLSTPREHICIHYNMYIYIYICYTYTYIYIYIYIYTHTQHSEGAATAGFGKKREGAGGLLN